MDAEKPTISDLPTEILGIIFSYLSFKDSLSASLVCHRWSGTAIPWSKTQLNLNYCSDYSIYDMFLGSDRPYRHLKLQNILHEFCYTVDKIWMVNRTSKMITKFRNSLETLEVKDVYDWDWMEEICGLPRLQYLSMNCSLVIKSPNLCSRRPCRSIRSLVIDEIDSYDFAFLNTFISETFLELTSLKLGDFIGDLYISGLPNLETLEVIGSGIVDDRLLQDLKALPKLRDIRLTVERLEFNCSAESLNNEQVRTVEIRSTERIDDEQLLQLTNAFPAINRFTIHNYYTNCTVAGVHAAKKRLPNCIFKIVPIDIELESESDSESESNLDSDYL